MSSAVCAHIWWQLDAVSFARVHGLERLLTDRAAYQSRSHARI